MVIEIIRYTIETGQEGEFEAAYREAGQYLDASHHCLRHQTTRCVEKPNKYIVRIEWDSMDGHLKGFRRSTEFRSFFTHVRPFVNAIDEMQHYEVI